MIAIEALWRLAVLRFDASPERSLAQLAAENCTISNAPVRIRDTPRFGFRGLMIDTARHFMPVKFLEHIIEGMAANRLNVLHWHIVDSQAFPYCSDKFPGLCEKGAYSARATYTAEQLSSLVDFAEAGVRWRCQPTIAARAFDRLLE